jgi:hypothetical protein
MSENQQGNDLQQLTHLVDTLKRVEIFDDNITVVSAVGSSMASALLLDLSSYVPINATDVFVSLFLAPTANAYWQLSTSTDGATSTKSMVAVYQNAINVLNSNYGIQKLTSNRGMYYQASKISGGGNALWIVKLHGYIEDV